MSLDKLHPFPELKTERLKLSTLDRVNIEHLLEITSFNNRANTKQEAENLVATINNQRLNAEGITWGLFLKSELIGTVGFYRGFNNQEGEVGYVIRDPYRRKGYLKESLSAVLKFGFEELKLTAISAYTPDFNHASIAVLNSFEFIKTEDFSGVHRKWLLKSELFKH